MQARRRPHLRLLNFLACLKIEEVGAAVGSVQAALSRRMILRSSIQGTRGVVVVGSG